MTSDHVGPEGQGTFESALARLEEIVKLLESGDLSLEETLAHYEEGSRLVKECAGRLDQAEQRIKVLSGEASPSPTGQAPAGEEVEVEDDSAEDGLPF